MSRSITPWKPIFAAASGGILEFYDFTVYGFLSIIIAKLFFPTNDPFVAAILGYSIFGVGFLMRPVGSILFGHLGDRYGRRIALYISLSLMGFATLVMGIVPTYTSIGYAAPIIMVLSRLVQGLSAGGEFNGGIIFVVEHASKDNRGFSGSLVVAGCMLGVLLGSVAGLLATLPGLPEWFWRVPFLVGACISFAGLYIRRKLTETPEFTAIKPEQKYKYPLVSGIKAFPKEFIAAMCIAGFGGINLYVNSIYMSSFFSKTLMVSDNLARLGSMLNILVMTLMIPVFGAISDKYGRAKIMKIGSVMTFMLVLTVLLPGRISSTLEMLLYQASFAFLASIFVGPMNIFIAEIFDSKVRYSCAAAGYSIGMAIFGGSAPTIAELFTSVLGPEYLALYICFGCFLGFLGTMLVKQKKALDINL